MQLCQYLKDNCNIRRKSAKLQEEIRGPTINSRVQVNKLPLNFTEKDFIKYSRSINH
ncbi:hypothetical protein NUSPORA_00553 [Nucleospora cyclopteri]